MPLDPATKLGHFHPNFANHGLSGTATTGYPAAGTPGFPLGLGESSESIAAGLGGGGNPGGFNPLFQQGGRVRFSLRCGSSPKYRGAI
jgi:hypothetical protein